MLRVLLVYDNLLLYRGLLVFVDWEQEGLRLYILLPMGAEALSYLKEH